MNINDVLIIKENIIDYKYKFPTIDLLIDINTDTKHHKYKQDKSYYYILDSNTSRDFGYWIFDSFIFINLLKDLNKNFKNQNIKIISKIKNYDIKDLLSYFNINNEIVNEIDNYNNICYSPKIYSIYYIHYLINDNYYNHFLNNYIEHINLNLYSNVNAYSYAFVNFHPNNPNYNDEIVKKIKTNTSEAYFIDNNYENVKYNLSILNNAKIIILLFDPSFYYNCIFLKNKSIIIVEDNIYRSNSIGTQIRSNTVLDYLFKIISSKNKTKIMKLEDVAKIFY